MWGTGILQDTANNANRFIPTHVGNGLTSPLSCWPNTVHPHACGERANWVVKANFSAGSSPRMWGTDFAPHDIAVRERFIPTHVGNGP